MNAIQVTSCSNSTKPIVDANKRAAQPKPRGNFVGYVCPELFCLCPLVSGKELFLLLSFVPDGFIDGEIEGDADNIGCWVSNDVGPASNEAS